MKRKSNDSDLNFALDYKKKFSCPPSELRNRLQITISTITVYITVAMELFSYPDYHEQMRKLLIWIHRLCKGPLNTER